VCPIDLKPIIVSALLFKNTSN